MRRENAIEASSIFVFVVVENLSLSLSILCLDLVSLFEAV